MPHVVNGCGTWYYGKKNVQTYTGQCRACGRVATLTSYDTRLFVVVIFIPIIPLAKKRIIEECGACKRHFAVAWGDYNRAENRLQEIMTSYRANPSDAEVAKEALQACATFRNVPAFNAIAPEIEAGMAQDGKTLAMIAAIYDLFGRLDQSERVLRNALAAAPGEDEIREMLADTIMRLGRPEEAEPLLQHVIDEGIPDRVNHIFRLAQFYQAKGKHEKAIELFQRCEQINPLITKDEAFQQLRGASEKQLGTGKVLKLGEVTSKAESAKKRRKFLKGAAAVLVLALMGYLIISAIIGFNRDVFVVNGLDRAYTVEINGKPHPVNAKSFFKLSTGEGNVKVRITDIPGAPPVQTVSVHSNFFTRLFKRNMFLINPDATAIIRHSRVYYSALGNVEPENIYSAGQVLHHFDDVDYQFEEPPESIKLDRRDASTSRTAVSMMGLRLNMSSAMVLRMMAKEFPEGTAGAIAKRHVQLEPESAEYYSIVNDLLPTADVVAFYKPLLEQRPLQLQWHRSYQEAAQRLPSPPDVEAEYTAMLAKEPANKELMYLASRAMKDIDRTIQLCEQAATGDDAVPYACYSRGSFALEMGKPAEAVTYLKHAVQLAPKDVTLKHFYALTLQANGDFDQALSTITPEENQPYPYCLAAFDREIEVLCKQKRRNDAMLVIPRLKFAIRQFGEATAQKIASQHEASIAYAFNDLSKYTQLLGQSTDPNDRIQASIASGSLEDAEKSFAEIEPKLAETDLDGNADWHAVLYLLATSRGDAASAKRHLTATAALLGKGDYEDRLYADAFLGKSTLPTDTLLRVRMQRERKVLLLAVLANMDSPHKAASLALARQLDISPRFPHLTVADALARASAN